jgi:hypothetical protein
MLTKAAREAQEEKTELKGLVVLLSVISFADQVCEQLAILQAAKNCDSLKV